MKNKATNYEESEIRIIRAIAKKGSRKKGKQSEPSSSKGLTICSREARAT